MMFDNIGENIKGLAKFYCFAGMAGSVIMALIMFGQASNAYGGEERLVASGILWLIFGPIISWISSWVLYGFGEIVEAATKINRKLGDNCEKTEISRIGSVNEPVSKEISIDDRIGPAVTKQMNFICPSCSEEIIFGDNECTRCKMKFDWSKLTDT